MKKTHQSGWEEHQKPISRPPPIHHPLHSSLLRPHPQIQYPSPPESLPNPGLITIKIHRIPIVVIIIVIVVAMIQQLRRYQSPIPNMHTTSSIARHRGEVVGQ